MRINYWDIHVNLSEITIQFLLCKILYIIFSIETHRMMLCSDCFEIRRKRFLNHNELELTTHMHTSWQHNICFTFAHDKWKFEIGIQRFTVRMAYVNSWGCLTTRIVKVNIQITFQLQRIRLVGCSLHSLAVKPEEWFGKMHKTMKSKYENLRTWQTLFPSLCSQLEHVPCH